MFDQGKSGGPGNRIWGVGLIFVIGLELEFLVNIKLDPVVLIV